MRRLSSLIFGFGSLFMLSPICLAELSFGIGVGYASSEETTRAEAANLIYYSTNDPLDHFSQDNTDIAFRLFAAYDVLSWLEFEAAYTDYGKQSFFAYDTTPPGSNPDVTLQYYSVGGSAELTGFSFSAIPKKHFSNGLVVNGKLGIFRWDMNAEVYRRDDRTFMDLSTDHYEEIVELDDNDIDTIIGIGISYSHFSLGYEHVKVDQANTDLVMLSVRF